MEKTWQWNAALTVVQDKHVIVQVLVRQLYFLPNINAKKNGLFRHSGQKNAKSTTNYTGLHIFLDVFFWPETPENFKMAIILTGT